jgi:DNA-binding transcriptional LysR family regulator
MKTDLSITRSQLDGIAAFITVANRRSFRAAADELGVSPSAVSQIIRGLESRIGVALLTRTTRRVGLTEAGERFLSEVSPAIQALRGAMQTAQTLSDEPAGLLRLNVPRAASGSLLDSLIPDFCAAHPLVQVEIFADDHLSDIVSEGFDAGIRLAARLQADMMAVRLTPPFSFLVVGSPTYFAKHGSPQHPRDLGSHRCIGFRSKTNEAVYRWQFSRRGRNIDVAVTGPLIVNDWAMAARAASLGMGLAYVPGPVAAPLIEDGQLVGVLEAFCLKSDGAFLYYPSHDLILPKLKAFVEFLRAHSRTASSRWAAS